MYCLALVIRNPERVVLGRNHRGWEMLGGHLEPGENVEQALRREAIEEGGFHISHSRLFGYRKVIAQTPTINDPYGGHYPRVAYIPHYIATTDRLLTDPSGEEIVEARIFSTEPLPGLEESQAIIAVAGLRAFRLQQP